MRERLSDWWSGIRFWWSGWVDHYRYRIGFCIRYLSPRKRWDENDECCFYCAKFKDGSCPIWPAKIGIPNGTAWEGEAVGREPFNRLFDYYSLVCERVNHKEGPCAHFAWAPHPDWDDEEDECQ